MPFFTFKKKRIFLDFASATPIRDEVRSLMSEYSRRHFANPSALYAEARETKEIMQNARGEVARFLNTSKDQIVFTSGGTESNNIALLGVFESARKNGIAHPHIISVQTEHPSVKEVFEEIKQRGGEVTVLMPSADGRITPSQVTDAMKEHTVLVSVMYVNNEIGTVQPIKEIAHAVKLKTKNSAVKTVFHTDACQAPLFYTLDVSTLGVDLLSLDGLKVGGPVGVGCLYVRAGTSLSPVMFGGGQEAGLRSGTEHVAGFLGLAHALTLAKDERKELSLRLEKLRDYFTEKILHTYADAELNGSHTHRVPNNINVCFKGIDAEHLVVALDTYGVCASYSSSCRTLKEDSSSYVVEALGKSDCMLSSIRFTLGRTTTEHDIDTALSALDKAITQVRRT